MEVRPGYKQTEVGVIPEEWDAKPLATLLLRNGRLGGNYSECRTSESDVPLMKIGEHRSGSRRHVEDRVHLAESTPEDEHRLADGDVVFDTSRHARTCRQGRDLAR